MSTITPTIERLSSDDSVYRFTWADMENGDDGAPVAAAFALWTDRSIQVVGTFGAAGNMRWQGSIDGTNYDALTDGQGNDINMTAAGIEAITEAVAISRPNITAGDGTTELTVTLIAIRHK